MTLPQPSSIYVVAGVNGAGKSSLAGATFRKEVGSDYYNPDAAARLILGKDPTLTQIEANSAAWREGLRLLKRAIAENKAYAFETTLGGKTIPRLLAEAASQGIAINIWYAGLSSPELHIERVRSRVRRGGHDIPEQDIRRRYEQSRLNLIKLLPHLAALRVFDNSAEADPAGGRAPKPTLVLHMEQGKIRTPPDDLKQTPEWAKPIVAAALKLTQR